MHYLIGFCLETNVHLIHAFSASSGQVVSVSSPASSSIKIEKPTTSGMSVKTVGPASAITIGGRKSGGEPSTSGNFIKIVSPNASSSSGNVKVVRVVSAGGGSPQKIIQVQKPAQAPRILNQSWNPEVKAEPAQNRAITVVRKTEMIEPPAKKTKYITLTSSQISQIEGATIINDGEKKRVVLPTNYKEQLEKLSISASPVKSSGQVFKIVQEVKKHDLEIDPLDMNKSYPGSKKTKRPCNCTKSQCLKFYCDCFAAGEYCQGCNCKDCLNDHDSEEREKAIKLSMERNPFAFK